MDTFNTIGGDLSYLDNVWPYAGWRTNRFHRCATGPRFALGSYESNVEVLPGNPFGVPGGVILMGELDPAQKNTPHTRRVFQTPGRAVRFRLAPLSPRRGCQHARCSPPRMKLSDTKHPDFKAVTSIRGRIVSYCDPAGTETLNPEQ